jgi:Concanavalin A-like lectin/glucanases superfamily/FG-GAP repeat
VLNQVIYPDLSSETNTGVKFGWSVDYDGSHIIVGAPLFTAPSTTDTAGKVFIYEKSGSTFTQVGAFQSIDTETISKFGESVSIKDSVAVAGGTGYGNNAGYPNLGAALIITKNSSTWELNDVITSRRPVRHSNMAFGTSVVFFDEFVAIGAPNHDYDRLNRSLTNCGAVYIFKNVSNSWVLWQKVTPLTTAPVAWNHANAYFGQSLSYDNGTLAIGSYGYRYDNTNVDVGLNHGAVFLYTKDAIDGHFYETERISPQGYNVTTDTNNFGYNVIMKGNWLVVGAPIHQYANDDSLTAVSSGAVFVYNKVDGVWNFVNKIYPTGTDRKAGLAFGTNMDFDGEYLAIGTPTAGSDEYNQNNSSGSGAVWLYKVESLADLEVFVVGGNPTTNATIEIVLDGTETLVDSINVTSGGAGYTSHPDIISNSSGFVADAFLAGTTVASADFITFASKVSVIPTVSVVNDPLDTTGSGATVEITGSGSAVASILVTDGGSGYTSLPEVTVSTGTSVNLLAKLTGTTVDTVSLTGVGTTDAIYWASSTITNNMPTVTISSPSSGTSATAHLTAEMTTIGAITNSSSNYSYIGEQFTVPFDITNAVIQTSAVTVTGTNANGVPTAFTIVSGGEFTGSQSLVSRTITRVVTTDNSGTITDSVTETRTGGSITDSTISQVFNSGSIGTSTMTIGTATTTTSIKGILKSIVKDTSGSGYTSVPTIAFSSGTGTAVATIAPTSVASVSVLDGGFDVDELSTVIFTGGTTETSATATLTTGVANITGLSVTNGGSGYTRLPTLSFSNSEFSGVLKLSPTTLDSVVIDSVDNTLTNPGRILYKKKVVEPNSNRRVSQLFGKSISGYDDVLAVGASMSSGVSGTNINNGGSIAIYEISSVENDRSNKVYVDGWLDASSVKSMIAGTFTFSMYYYVPLKDGITNGGSLLAIKNSTPTSTIHRHLIRITNEGKVIVCDTNRYITMGYVSQEQGWNHIIYSVNAGVASLYINGDFIGSTDVDTTVDSDTVVSLGAMFAEDQTSISDEPALNGFKGYISDIAFWTTALSSNDVADVINNGASTVQSSFIKAHWLPN